MPELFASHIQAAKGITSPTSSSPSVPVLLAPLHPSGQGSDWGLLVPVLGAFASQRPVVLPACGYPCVTFTRARMNQDVWDAGPPRARFTKWQWQNMLQTNLATVPTSIWEAPHFYVALGKDIIVSANAASSKAAQTDLHQGFILSHGIKEGAYRNPPSAELQRESAERDIAAACPGRWQQCHHTYPRPLTHRPTVWFPADAMPQLDEV